MARAYSEAGQSLYSQGAASGDAAEQQAGAEATAGAAAATDPDSDVVEAEYEIVDEEKK